MSLPTMNDLQIMFPRRGANIQMDSSLRLMNALFVILNEVKNPIGCPHALVWIAKPQNDRPGSLSAGIHSTARRWFRVSE